MSSGDYLKDDTGYCNGCGGRHPLEYGKSKNRITGEMEETKLLGFVKCTVNGKLYLATVNENEVFPNKPNNLVFMGGLDEEDKPPKCTVRATDGDGEDMTIRCHDAKEALTYAKACLGENYKKIKLEIGDD